MKKLVSGMLALVLGAATVCAVTACDDSYETYTVYAPDGAPALALANAVQEEGEGENFDFRIVDSSTIAAQVQGETPNADFCILPVNAAAKFLGTGETYQMLGTVTNGNMYLLTTGENPVITSDNLSSLVGKTVGVVQLANVPGLTLQAVLKANQIAYQTLGNDAQPAADKVNLKAIADASSGVTPAGGCDYYLCPEPAASAKLRGTASSANPFKAAGSLQELYGENGYPQAVLVAKKTVIDSDSEAVGKMIEYMNGSDEYLAAASAEDVVNVLADCYTDGLEPSLNAKTLTKEVIENCSVYFTAAQDCKERVNAFLAELIDVNPEFTTTVSDSFYYAG